MCLALAALDAHPRFCAVIAANRDEFHARDAEPAHWWPDGRLAGRDRVGGGTWFGVDRRGRWALVTNYREGIPRDPDAPSRGMLVARALGDRASALASAASLALDGSRYHGYSLLVGDEGTAAYTTNRASGALALRSGVVGLSNHLLETPWPKVVRSKSRMDAWLDSGSDDVGALFDLLADRAQADATALPSTGVPVDWERRLSSAFIVDPTYGTRCSTVLTIGRDGAARFIEKSFDAAGREASEARFDFRISR
ncbi:MAG TPA: NRDE family protein [Casimicrobiaceae bacterium]|nr:NRDE family protein [Casimicrobiaceae bacterium]